MTTNKIGILFDLDGVLVDSEGEYTRFWGNIGRKFNVGGPGFAADIKGTTLNEILQNFPVGERDGIVEELHDFESKMSYPMIPGASSFLSMLREAGIPFAIVTSSDNTKMDYLFKAHPELKECVAALVTGSMITHSKPDPEGYLKGAEMIGVPIENCFVFEDSLQGLQAGMASGATVVGLATTNPREIIKDRAHKVISDFTGFTLDDIKTIKRRD